MKHLIFWSSLVITTILIGLLWEKNSVMTIFDKANSPLYLDVILVFCGLNLVITRGAALLRKIFF